MRIQPSEIPDVLLIQPQVFSDERGFFKETFRASSFAQAGLPVSFVQDNHSGSQQGILRGLHYQIRRPQGKLLWVVTGEIYDVAVDIRRGSPTFKKWIGVKLTADSHQQLWIPPGFAHGFYVVSEWAEVAYKVTDIYAPEWERTILWNDRELNISWPIVKDKLTLSSKDQKGKSLSEAELFD